jgi:hypothetical protein
MKRPHYFIIKRKFDPWFVKIVDHTQDVHVHKKTSKRWLDSWTDGQNNTYLCNCFQMMTRVLFDIPQFFLE